MTALRTERVATALAPVRAQILRRARSDAEQVLADARNDAARICEQADDEARHLTDAARQAGEAAAASLLDAQSAAIERTLRRELLVAQDEAYNQWRRRAAEAVLRLRNDPEYPRWRDVLSGTARELLGSDARVTEAAEGGVIAESGRRRVDLSLSAVAERALDRMARHVAGLWS